MTDQSKPTSNQDDSGLSDALMGLSQQCTYLAIALGALFDDMIDTDPEGHKRLRERIRPILERAIANHPPRDRAKQMIELLFLALRDGDEGLDQK